jgi:outer membrane receptor protein involved in Fe transport
MKSFLSLVITFITCSWALAQSEAPLSRGSGKITGSVIDSSNSQPVEFATVALTEPNSEKPVNGAVCDDKGKFTITKVPDGTYQLIISFIGYENVIVKNIVISDKKSNVDVGPQKLATSSKELEAVVIEGQKSLVEEKVDRTIYNAENDATAKGGDATDVLRRVPMLSVDMDGNVSLRGNQNIKVLINNKPSTISASSVADALKQIPSDQIKTVEVITSPSAKYDAEGSAGIINIITKKNNLQGLTLNIDGSSGYRGTNLGLNGSYRKGKMGFSLGGFGRSGYNITGKFDNTQITTSNDINGNPVQTTNVQTATTRSSNLFGNTQFGWDYDINKNNSLTASVRFGSRNGWNNQDHLSTITTSPTLSTSTLKDVQTTDQSQNVDASLNYTHTFAKPQQEFSVLALFSRNDRTNDFLNAFLDLNDFSTTSRLKNINNSFNQEITIQADYQTPIGTTQMLEFGGKNISRKVSSDYKYLLAPGSEGEYAPSPNASLANVFNYDQNVMSSYLSYTYAMKSGYSFKAGARYEYTTINANFATEKAPVVIPSYGVLVPSANLSKKLKNGSTVKIAYNRRIQRPSIQFLNPNIQASNPLSISVGNPNLGPEYTNNYELSYSTFIKSSSLNFSTFVRNTNNAIQSVRDVIGNNPADVDTIRTTYQNIGSENAYGASIFAGVNVSGKLSLNGGTDIYYAVLKNNVPDPIYNASNQGWVASYRLFGNYTLSKGWGLQFFSFYRGRQVQLQGIQGSFYVYSLSIKKDLKDKKGSIGFGAEQFFTPAMRINSNTSSPIIQQNSTNEMHNMNFKITFSYRIGKMTFDQGRKRKKSIENDDMKDGGDNGGGGGMDQAQGAGAGAGAAGGGGGRFSGGGRPNAPAAQQKSKPVDSTAVVNAEGKWSYTVESPQGGAGTIAIKKEGDKYTGTMTSQRGGNRENQLNDISVKGNEISFSYDVNFGGNASKISVKAIIEGDAMSGTMSVGSFGSFPLNAKRAQN